MSLPDLWFPPQPYLPISDILIFSYHSDCKKWKQRAFPMEIARCSSFHSISKNVPAAPVLSRRRKQLWKLQKTI
jgi:hypothetical protein